MDALQQALADDPRVEYALLFGSRVRGTAHEGSDLDVAVGVRAGERLEARELGELVSRLERATGSPVDVILLDEAPIVVAYRVFRDGRVLVMKNHRAFVARKARAILEYLDFSPVEALTTRGVLAAARGR